MAIAKRCLFCRQKLREDGYCINPNCADYPRTLIHDEAHKDDPPQEDIPQDNVPQ